MPAGAVPRKGRAVRLWRPCPARRRPTAGRSFHRIKEPQDAFPQHGLERPGHLDPSCALGGRTLHSRDRPAHGDHQECRDRQGSSPEPFRRSVADRNKAENFAREVRGARTGDPATRVPTGPGRGCRSHLDDACTARCPTSTRPPNKRVLPMAGRRASSARFPALRRASALRATLLRDALPVGLRTPGTRHRRRDRVTVGGPDDRRTGQLAAVVVRGKMGQVGAIAAAYTKAHAIAASPFCIDIRSCPSRILPGRSPHLDRICSEQTAFGTFLDLLIAVAGYRPSIRLDLMGRDGVDLARAYDRMQARRGDPRRAFVTGGEESRTCRGLPPVDPARPHGSRRRRPRPGL